MSDLPKGWAKCTTNDIAEVVGGGTPKSTESSNFTDNGIPWLTPADLTGYHDMYIGKGKRDITEKGLSGSSARLMPRGTVLFSSRAPIGYVAIAENEISTNQGFKSLVCNQGIIPEYVYFYMKYVKPLAESLASGTTFLELSGKRAKEIPVNLAPTNEQERIAKKLKAILEQLNETKARLNRVPDLLKKFRQSVLEAACTGKLTIDWRYSNGKTTPVLDTLSEFREANKTKEEKYTVLEKVKSIRFKEPVPPDLTHWDKPIPKTWAMVSVSQFAECLDSVRYPIKKEYRKAAKGLYPYFGANGEVGKIDEYIFDDTITLVTEDETFYGRTKPIAYLSHGKCWVNNHAHVLRSYSAEATEFLCYSLMYYHVIPWLSGTTGRAKLTQEDLLKLPIAVPPKEELPMVVKAIRSKLGEVESYLSSLNTLNDLFTNLEKSVLQTAFEGRLVEQNSNDEPASVLLEKILAEREASKPKKKSKKKVSKKKSRRNVKSVQALVALREKL